MPDDQTTEITETPAAETPPPANGEDQTEKPLPETFTEAQAEGLSPQEQARFKKMQSEYTKKTQAIAQMRKELENERKFYAQLNEDPAYHKYMDAYMREKQGGEREIPQLAADDEPADTIPEELKPYQKAIELIADRVVEQRLKAQVEPIVEKFNRTSTRSLLREFQEDHKDWKDHEQSLVRMVMHPQFRHLATDRDGLEALWKVATYDDAIRKAQAIGAKQGLGRTNQPMGTTPKGGGIPKKTVQNIADVNSFADAVAFAKSQVESDSGGEE